MSYKKYLTEKVDGKTKDLSMKLTSLMMNSVDKAINEWQKKYIDPITGFDYPNQREEIFEIVSSDMLDFFKGMNKAAKRDLKRK